MAGKGLFHVFEVGDVFTGKVNIVNLYTCQIFSTVQVKSTQGKTENKQKLIL